MRIRSRSGAFISSKIGKAIKDYNMIEEGDSILVAVSGGKDSLTLLRLLRERQRWSPVKYDLIAAHIETDMKCGVRVGNKYLKDLFEDIGVEYIFRKMKLHEAKTEKKPNCFWCAWNRRKFLFQAAYDRGCGKVALAHHKDDIIETTLLNLFFLGEISTMNPRQELFDGKITIIRPLCYVEESTIRQFARENDFPGDEGGTADPRNANRLYLKNVIKDLQKRSPVVKANIFNSIARVKSEYINLIED